MSKLLLSPSVNVKPISRTNPIVEQAINEIKDLIRENGFASIGDYIAMQKEYKLRDEILLPAMQQTGLGFVKTGAIQHFQPQEMIIDLRHMAAAMLLVYSDDNFGFRYSVLRYLEVIFGMGTWRAAFPMIHHKGLLEDIYSTYGHHFSDMAMSDAAVLLEDDPEAIQQAIEKMAKRHIAAIHELSRNDIALTRVYHLALQTFNQLNDKQSKGGSHDYLYYRPWYQDQKDPSQPGKFQRTDNGYRHFWRIAVNKILVPYRPKREENLRTFRKS